ncbi:MAG: protoporphyrinogen oxidase [Pyrinomonadaceae bacterium]
MSGKVCIIGGGISGLCVAYRLNKAGVDVGVLEKNSEVGGNIHTSRDAGFLYEHGPNSTLTTRELLDLIDQLGLTSQIALAKPAAKKRFIIKKGKLTALPSAPVGLLNTRAFTRRSVLGLLKEPFTKRGSRDNESVADFFTRRLGPEIVNYAVDPFISGIYAGDPQKLAVEFALPKLYRFESEHGSILKGAFKSRKNGKQKLPKGTPRSLSFVGGMQTLTNSLQEELRGKITTNCGETKVESDRLGVNVIVNGCTERFDCLVISTPAYIAAEFLRPISGEVSAALDSVFYPPVSVVYLGFKATDVLVAPNGFGFLAPHLEKRPVLGSLFTSSVFEGRAPEGHHLFTTFIGGSRDPELAGLDEEQLTDIALDELRSLMGVRGIPVFKAVKKWKKAIPQYNIGYGRVLDAIKVFRQNHPHIFLCSNYLNGISVSDCIKNAAETAAEVIEYLSSKKTNE